MIVYFFIDCHNNSACFFQALPSCQTVITLIPSAPSGVYNITISGTVYPTWCQVYSGAMYALIIKTDGAKVCLIHFYFMTICEHC